jgi:hypothetical protein
MFDIFFVTFADSKYQKTLDRIRQEAINMNVFRDIFVWNENDLDKEWKERHISFINSHARGKHRHDQSIFSLLIKTRKGRLIPVWPNTSEFPIHTSRLKF